MTPEAQLFTQNLLNWFATNHRPMPWKGERNPYLIWLSEIILQQTRVEQGLPYYLRFVEAYPTVKHLADAPIDEVLKLWEGLGYYARARNLHQTAQHITYELEQKFPTTFEGLLQLKGVGQYTAAAIASFAYQLPHAVIDGNVYRVLARYFGIATPIDSPEGQKEFQALAQKLLDAQRAADYNQAIMDFGATICTPKLPNCAICPMNQQCVALQQKKVADLPIKLKKISKKTRYFNYFVYQYQSDVWIVQRTEKDIWQQLFEFPLVERESILEINDLIEKSEFDTIFFGEKDIHNIRVSRPYKQQLTHQNIIAVFFEIKLLEAPKQLPKHWIKVNNIEIKKIAFPKIIDLYFQDKSLSLTLF